MVKGKIKEVKDTENNELNIRLSDNNEKHVLLTEDDIYKEFRLRGYNYRSMPFLHIRAIIVYRQFFRHLFKGVKQYNITTSMGLLEWNENWVAFMDNMLQILILDVKLRNLCVPVSIDKVTINPQIHTAYCKDRKFVPVYLEPSTKVLR